MEIIVRQAMMEDVDGLYAIIDHYAQSGIMLPRSKKLIANKIDTFVVAVDAERIIGCGSLFQLGSDLVEIRSLGVADGYKGRGVGGMLVDELVKQAKANNWVKVMALTYEVGFFEKNGFSVVDKEIFPEKVWTDCIHCKKQNCCDEIAVLKRLD